MKHFLTFAAFRTEMRAEHRTGRAPSMTGRTSFSYCIYVFILIHLYRWFSYVSSTSYRVHALSFGAQWPLYPSYTWLRRHNPGNSAQLLIILKDPRNPAVPQPDFPGEESGRDSHPAQIARNNS